MFTEGKQHLAYHTLQHHQAPHCRSDLLYKGALQDSSRTVWRGMIKVDPGARRPTATSGTTTCCSATGPRRLDPRPGNRGRRRALHARGHDRARVDDEQIFYAMCRGLTRREAMRMIVTGFFQQIFDRITIESVRDALGQAIAARVREYE